MAVVAVVGGPGAPGATTTALALLLSWPLPPGRKVLLAECDPDGGAVLAGALEGRIEAVYGLRNLAVADRRGLLAQTVWEQLVDLSPEGTAERLLLPGLTDPAQAPGLAYTWEPLADTFQALDGQGYDVIVDLGRSGATGPGAVLARRADVVVATVRTTLRGLSAARPRLAALRDDLESAARVPTRSACCRSARARTRWPRPPANSASPRWACCPTRRAPPGCSPTAGTPPTGGSSAPS
ncbi:hypothetical protein ACFQ1I_35755 [Kitasatospora arboriphila]